MKKLNKFLLSVLAVFALAIVLKLPVNASAIQANCDNSSITIQINQPGYIITGYNYSTTYYDPNTINYVSVTPTANQYTFKISNLTPNIPVTGLYVYAKLTNSTGNYVYRTYTYVNTLPASAGSNNFAVDDVLYSTRKVSFKVSNNSSADGFVLELYKNGKNVLSKSFTGSYSGYLPVAANNTYQYRVKYYVTNPSNGKTYYSSNWSPMRKFCLATYSGKSRSNKRGFSLTLKKAAGVSKYLVYVSKTSSTAGFKKVASVALGSKAKKTIQITKNYKKKARNYIKIIPVFKDGTKSDVISTGSIYVFK